MVTLCSFLLAGNVSFASIAPLSEISTESEETAAWLNLTVQRISGNYEQVYVFGTYNDITGNSNEFNFVTSAIVIGDEDPTHTVTITLNPGVGATHVDFHVFSHQFHFDFMPPTLVTTIDLPFSITTSFDAGPVSISIAPVPEPATAVLLGLGGLAIMRKRRG